MLKPALASCLAAALIASAARAATPAEGPRPSDGYDQQAMAVAPGVWAFVQSGFQIQPAGNVTLIEQAEGLVLVDTGGSPGAARRLIAEIRRLSTKPVKAVIITHWHGDHSQGLAQILEAWPQARTIATRATQAHLASRKTMNTPATFDAAADEAFYKRGQGFIAYTRRMADQAATPAEKEGWSAAGRMFTQYAEDMRGAVTLSTRESFDDHLLLPDRHAPVEVRFLGRASTDGDAVVWLPRQKVMISGDLVVAPIPFGFGSYPGDWLDSLARLETYDFKVLVPGHGQPRRDYAYVRRVVAAITEIRGRVGPLARGGVPLEDVRKKIDVTAQARAFIGDDPWLRRWFIEYWVSPIVASAYKEALGEPIVQGLGNE